MHGARWVKTYSSQCFWLYLSEYISDRNEGSNFTKISTTQTIFFLSLKLMGKKR